MAANHPCTAGLGYQNYILHRKMSICEGDIALTQLNWPAIVFPNKITISHPSSRSIDLLMVEEKHCRDLMQLHICFERGFGTTRPVVPKWSQDMTRYLSKFNNQT